MIFWRAGSTPVMEKSWYLSVSPVEVGSTSTSCFLPWCLTMTAAPGRQQRPDGGRGKEEWVGVGADLGWPP